MNDYAGALQDGLDTVRQGQTISFITYERVILPYDGFVYWVKTGNEQTLVASMVHDENELHHEDQNFRNDSGLIITTTEPLLDFSQDGLDTMSVFEYNNNLYVLRKTGYNSEQSGLFHNIARVIEPALRSILLDSKDDFLKKKAQFTNSIGLFVLLSCGYFEFVSIDYPIYPEWLVPLNKKPPYITVGVTETEALNNGFNTVNVDNSLFLVKPAKDYVDINLYGLDNNEALNFLVKLERWSLFYKKIGFLNMPRIKDEQLAQNEIGSLAQKKIIELEIFYYQGGDMDDDLHNQMIDQVLLNINNDGMKNVFRCER